MRTTPPVAAEPVLSHLPQRVQTLSCQGSKAWRQYLLWLLGPNSFRMRYPDPRGAFEAEAVLQQVEIEKTTSTTPPAGLEGER